ncbi:MAG TPA: hypothetical protein PKY01_01120 [Candidatus Hydrogenedentes bacterium]|nr:hypothetical protein [Candidatus Hydrogenedentota bacterium]HQH50992.1 hypothetical protein [Candidatus Hydrogenedentota bacterium]HQM49919.1 hypothetical protein [Candidatus Hydrogenedentota bacterium]
MRQQLEKIKQGLGTAQGRYARAAGLILIGLACLLLTRDVQYLTGYDFLNSSAAGSIDDALEKNAYVFLGVSSVKAGMAVIEGSSIGVGFNIEIGDLVQSVYDYIDYVWKVLLYGLTILAFYKMLLETGFLAVGIKIIGIGLVLWAGAALWPKRRRAFNRAGLRFVSLGALVAYVVPLALLATDLLGNVYIEPLKEKNREQIFAVVKQFERTKTEFNMLREKLSLVNPGESLEQLKQGLTKAANSLGNLLNESLLMFVQYAALLFFELLFFPFLSAVVLYKMAQIALARVVEVPSEAAKTVPAKAEA